MKSFLLRDEEDGVFDAIISTETTTKAEIEEIIEKAKEKFRADDCDEYLTDIIKSMLPPDCSMICPIDNLDFIIDY